MQTSRSRSSATIDVGRLETLKRREKFSKLSAYVFATSFKTTPAFELDNNSMLSPRRINRKISERTTQILDAMGLETLPETGNNVYTLRGDVAIRMAETIYRAMKDYADNDYPNPTFRYRVPDSGWTIILRVNE